MRDQPRKPPTDQFLLIADAARLLNLDQKVLRQGIACGLVPIRRDNTGTIRVHQDDVPAGLHEKINLSEVKPELQAAVLADELANLEKSLKDSETQRNRLEVLVKNQGAALTRYSALLDIEVGGGRQNDSNATDTIVSLTDELRARDAEVEKLSNILQRTFHAIETRDRQVAQETGQLTRTADKAMKLLERAVREGEISTDQLNSLNQQIGTSTNTSSRLEHELEQRNSTINDQHGLIERMVALAEQSANGTVEKKPRKRSIWQRLFGGGKGI